jgi:hypothetical protein
MRPDLLRSTFKWPGFYVDESGHFNRKRHDRIQTFRVLGEFGNP